MHNLSISLDSVVCPIATATNLDVVYLISSAVLLSDGWVFSIPEHWDELLETLGEDRRDSVVTLEQAIALPGHLSTEETPPGIPPRFNRIDYLAALFAAAADVALGPVPKSEVNLAVAVPGTIVCADALNRRKALQPGGGSSAATAPRGVTAFDPYEKSLLADIRRAAVRAGFANCRTSPAAMEAARQLLLSTEAVAIREKLQKSRVNLACAVELGAQGIALLPLKLVSGTSVEFGKQCLFLECDWVNLLRGAVLENFSRDLLAPELAESVWRKLEPAAATGKLPAPLLYGTKRIAFTSLDLGVQWRTTTDKIASYLLFNSTIQPGEFVRWLALPPGEEKHPVVHFFVSGLGTALPQLRAAIEGLFAGDPANARNQNRGELYGLLDTSGLDLSAAPRWLESNGDVAVKGHLKNVAEGAPPPAPPVVALYSSVRVQPISVAKDASTLEMKLQVPARPALGRSSLLHRDVEPRFALTLEKVSGDVHEVQVVFTPRNWETNYRLEIEVRVDMGDCLTVHTRIGGRRVAVQFLSSNRKGVKSIKHTCIGLGAYEVYADDSSRELAKVMNTEQVRAAAKYQVFKAEAADA